MTVRPVVSRRKLVVIEEGLLVSMALTDRFVAAFPALKQVQALTVPGTKVNKSKCRSCRSKLLPHRSDIMSRAKLALASLSSTQQRQLAQMLNAEQLRITYRQGTLTRTLTFP